MQEKSPPWDPEFLQKSVDDLQLTEELIAYMRAMQFKNLQQLLEFSVSDLLNTKGFGYRCLYNLQDVLEENGCMGLLKDRKY
ncbi:MAG: DNA-directed RNA polymerase subunit alpha C-terminal domain-containing protein [Cyclobacteriaceae bacterium]